MWGGIIATGVPISELNAMQWTGAPILIEVIGLVGCTPWGWPLLPMLAILFYGALTLEWSRLLVTSALAIVIGTASLIAQQFYWYEYPGYWCRLIYPIVLLALTLLLPPLIRLYRRHRHPFPEARTPS